MAVNGAAATPLLVSTLEFGSTRVGGFAPAHDFSVRNTGLVAVTIQASQVPPGFSVVGLPVTLTPGQSAAFSVDLSSATQGQRTGLLEVTTTAPTAAWFRWNVSGAVLPGAGAMLLNPSWSTRPWKLWFDDASPVAYTGLDDPNGDGMGTFMTQSFEPTDAGVRRFPTPAALDAGVSGFFLEAAVSAMPPRAGWWDDASGTMDRGHSRPATGLVIGGTNRIDLAGQFIRVPWGNPSASMRHALGLNFTSESYAYSGHQLTTSGFSVGVTERDWFFANAIRGTPSFYSFCDTDAAMAGDNYDGLYAQSYQSLGRSGSEREGLFKMLLAGGYLPRRVKEQLKRHGAYGPAVLTLFREQLPIVALDGSPVPYESPFIQRPTYLSTGNNTSVQAEFGGENFPWHQYSNPLHVFQMIAKARAMTTAPPVGVLRLVSLEARLGAMVTVPPTTSTSRLRVNARTMVTAWPQPGEEVTLRVDLGESIDLDGAPLTFSAHVVYPNQQPTIDVQREGRTALYRLRFTPGGGLPVGRRTVLLQATVRGQRSNPLFVNVFYPQATQLALTSTEYFHPSRSGGAYTITDPRKAVLLNQRPVLTNSLGPWDVSGTVNVPVTATVSCTDPEGFPVTLARRAGEPGTFVGTTWSFTPTAPGTYVAGVLCSDGTGGTAGRAFTVTVP